MRTGTKSALSVAVLSGCLMAIVASPAVASDREASLGSDDLLYSYDEMFDFDIEAYLSQRAPHLLPYAETISHWAGYSRISPKVLMALMEQRSGVITRERAAADALRRPLGDLAEADGFGEQVREVAVALRQALYEREDPDLDHVGRVKLARVNPLQSLYLQAGETESSAAVLGDSEFQLAYARLFNEARKAAPPSPEFASAQTDAVVASPPNGFLQFPFPRGARWHVGGAHTNTGQGSYPMSSLDMSQGGGWGSNQSHLWVSASAAGRFVRHSSCFAEVVHSGGWSTTYYHLMNIQYGTNAQVSANTAIANPANTQSQALCNGGASTGPHQHWSLKQNGSDYHLNGVILAGYTITATGSSYDTNCSRFYLRRNGSNFCAGYFTNP